MLQDGSIFAQSPSFNSYTSDNFAQIAAKVCEEFVDDRVQLGLEPLQNEEEENHDDDDEIVQAQEEEKYDDPPEEHEEEDEEEEEEEDESEFEFSFLSGDGIAISADEIFANGQIRPVYPIFNRDLLFAGGKDYDEDDDHTDGSKQPKKNSSLRKLFIGEREEDDGHSCSSSEADVDELHNLPAGTYCVWKPKQQLSTASSPDTCKKSKSTGSSSSSVSRSATATAASVSKRWRFRDFLFRSNSDGKDTFVFLTPSVSSSTNKMMMKNGREEKLVIEEKLEKVVVAGNKVAAGKGKLKSGAAAEVSAHEIHYVRNRALKENDKKKSYLPYRQDLVGLFANVNGLNRNLRPF
ncbi:hypothetical protein C5167_030312 [Papaver somniferum]|uniref:histone H3.v1-like n=1 Tax=Papaver somniferum TaxID=3469 RepID=UPI000E6FC1C2|nr:histone H3.v1-like [Papaver somniferum]RZC86961.1 hypothetical protein C5167_030312 [Papaver somniferum]